MRARPTPAAGASGIPRSAWLRLLWQPAAFAIPFALFFGTLFGSGAGGYLAAYRMALVFSYVTMLAVMLTRHVLVPRLLGTHHDIDRRAYLVREVVLYMAVSILATFVAAAILHFTFAPGLLGSSRAITFIAMFGLLFSVLAMAIVYAVLFYQRAIERARAEQELQLARRIQRSFLLSDFPELPGLEVYATNLSSREVSGDFYDVVPSGPNAWLLAIADVSGKGVPAALLTSMLQASLRTLAETTASVSTILASINRMVARRAAPGQFATFFLARVDLESRRLACTNAGHNYPVVFRADGGRELLVRGGVVVGAFEGAAFEEEQVDLRPGDRIVLYTDGVSEAEDAAGAMYGEERLYALVQSLPRDLDARATAERILESLRAFLAGKEPGDDITLMVLRVLPPEGAARG